MAAHYLDSSALVKRYVREVGTDWLRALVDLHAHRRAAGLSDPRLVSADDELNAAAVAMGFVVENPNEHA